MVDKARGVIEPGSTSVVIPGVPAGASLTVTAYAEDVYGQASAPVSDTIDTSAEQVALTDPVVGVPILTTNTDPSQGAVGAQPFLYNEWKRGIRNGDFHDPPPDADSPINNTDNRLPGFLLDDTSAGTMVPMWVPDASGSGGTVVVTVGASASGHLYLYQDIGIRATTSRNNSFVMVTSAESNFSDDDFLHHFVMDVFEYDTDGVLIGNPVHENETPFDPDTVDDFVAVMDGGIAANTYFLRVQVGVTNTQAGLELTFHEITLVEGPPLTVIPDLFDPTQPPGVIFQSGGTMYLMPGANSTLGSYPRIQIDQPDNFIGIDTDGGTLSLGGSGTTVDLGSSEINSLLLPRSDAAAPTADGSMAWNSDDGVIKVGDGSGTKTFGYIGYPVGPLAYTVISPTALAGNVNDYNPTGLADATVIRIDPGGANRTITGLQAPSPAETVVKVIHNIGTGNNLLVTDQDASSSSDNQFLTPGSFTNTIGPNGTAMVIYDVASAKWRLIPHTLVNRTTAPTTSAVGDAASVGNSSNAAPRDHVHGREGFSASTPAAVTSAGAVGTATTLSHSDHGHPHEAAHVAHDTLYDAKGDIPVGTGADTAAKVTVGANDTLFMADSTQSSGVKWANPATVKTALGYYTSGDSPSFGKVTTTNGGVAFPSAQVADADPNTLDDYEESNSWTPSFSWATPGTSSISHSTQAGTYTKIGRVVILQFICVATVTRGTGSGNFQITGSPFSQMNVTGTANRGAVQFTGYTKANFTWVVAGMGQGSSTITFLASGSGQTTATLGGADITDGTVSCQGTLIIFV